MDTSDSTGVGAQESTSLSDKYYKWCEAEARKINSDGCTLVSEWHQSCCFEHDLACHYGKDPKDAFRIYLTGLTGFDSGIDWHLAKKMSRRAADKAYAACNFSKSKDIEGFARSAVRYIGVRLGSFWPF